jgi:hypothetical protein
MATTTETTTEAHPCGQCRASAAAHAGNVTHPRPEFVRTRGDAYDTSPKLPVRIGYPSGHVARPACREPSHVASPRMSPRRAWAMSRLGVRRVLAARIVTELRCGKLRVPQALRPFGRLGNGTATALRPADASRCSRLGSRGEMDRGTTYEIVRRSTSARAVWAAPFFDRGDCDVGDKARSRRLRGGCAGRMLSPFRTRAPNR